MTKAKGGDSPRWSRSIPYRDISLGISREELVALLGEPDDVGGTSRKYRTPGVYKYDDVEFHFAPSNKLCIIGYDDAEYNFHTVKKDW